MRGEKVGSRRERVSVSVRARRGGRKWKLQSESVRREGKRWNEESSGERKRAGRGEKVEEKGQA